MHIQCMLKYGQTQYDRMCWRKQKKTMCMCLPKNQNTPNLMRNGRLLTRNGIKLWKSEQHWRDIWCLFLMKLVPNQPTELLQMFPIHSLFDFYRQFTEDLKITNQPHDEVQQKQALGNHLEFYLYPKATITVWKKYCSIWFTKFYWVVITSEGRVGLKTPKLDASSSTVWKL